MLTIIKFLCFYNNDFVDFLCQCFYFRKRAEESRIEHNLRLTVVVVLHYTRLVILLWLLPVDSMPFILIGILFVIRRFECLS